MKSKPSSPKPKQPSSLEEKLANALNRQAVWETVAANPALSPRAAAWAMGMADSWGAAVTLGQKAQAHQRAQEQGPSDLEQMLDLHSVQRQLPPSDPENPPSSTKPGTSA